MMQAIAYSSAGIGFCWLMITTECRPFLPLVKLIVQLGGAA